MNGPLPRPGVLGLTGYLLAGLTLGITFLLVHGALGVTAIAEAVGSAVTTSIRDGSSLTITLLAFFVLLPFFTVGIAALMGRHGAHTGQGAAGAAALTALIGVPLLWVNLAIAALVVGAIHGSQAISGAFDNVVDSLLASAVALLFALGPLVGLAALVAGRAAAWSQATAAATGAAPMSTGYAETYGAPEEGAHALEEPARGAAPEPAALHEHPVDCPRCGNSFSVSGERPLRIECPECGKTGMIR